MSELLTGATNRVVDAVAAIDDPVLGEMEERTARTGFPTVGPAAGRFLRLLVHATDAGRVFECGSGFGYSAYWMAGALPSDGEIVLTEVDADELADARVYFEAGGLADRARFEHGDALEILAASEDAYDLILLDHEKEQYPDGLAVARERLESGGTLVADNVCATASYGPDEVADALEADRQPDNGNPAVQGVARCCRDLVAEEAFETAVVPLGEGLLVAAHRPTDR